MLPSDGRPMTLRDALRGVAEDHDLSGGNFGEHDHDKWIEATVDSILLKLNDYGFDGTEVGKVLEPMT